MQVDIHKTKGYFVTEICDKWGDHTRDPDDICLYVTPYSLVEIRRLLRDSFCPHIQGRRNDAVNS
jgi:hypothetical protein